MSRSYSRVVAKKLAEIIETSKDQALVVEAANTLAKYLPKPKSPSRRKGTHVSPIKKEPTVDDLVALVEKWRKGLPLTESEQKWVAEVEKKRSEALTL